MTVRYLSEHDTRTLLAWPDVIACLTAAYARADDPRAAPPRVVARAGGMWLRALTAISQNGDCMGAKLIVKGASRSADHFIALWNQKNGALAGSGRRIRAQTRIADRCRARTRGRRQRKDNIVLFKSVGSGLQDIAVSESRVTQHCDQREHT